MKKDFENRIIKLRKILEEKNVDAILIYKNRDVLYTTGFYDKENNSVAIISKDKLIFMTDGRFVNQFHEQVEGFDLILFENIFNKFEKVNEVLKENNINKYLVNFEAISYKDALSLDANIENVVDSTELITNFRRTKTEEEIKLTRKACDIAEQSLLFTLDQIKEGMTELEIQNILNSEMSRRGSSRVAFPTIVVSGPDNGASPHGVPTERKVQQGDFITIDFGATYQNYTSDITRTIAIGKVSDEMMEIYNQVLKAKTECVSMLKPGESTNKIHKHADSVLKEIGYDLVHGLGHGIGLENHELPKLTISTDYQLQVNDIHTIEPGIYAPGICGVRIEDDYLITDDGYECLTPNITNELITL
ncbi:MAG: Xaa-Pro peptidase family protein [Coriobacteriia bacterium]|nr:Xaa-Pro peptidase family protein [Coriobacteriia bacterium]